MSSWARSCAAVGLAALVGCSPVKPAPSGPTPLLEPPSIRDLPGRGVALEGHGSAESDEVTPRYDGGLPLGIDVVSQTHDAQCLGGSILVEDNTGMIQDTPQVEFPRGPCFWEVRADGAWSLKPAP